MPLANIIVIVSAVLLALGLFLWFLSRHVTKLGPVELRKEHVGETNLENLRREIKTHDDAFRTRIRSIITAMEPRLVTVFAQHKVCAVIRLSFAWAVLGPLYDAAHDNRFTSVLLPENRDVYIDRVMTAIRTRFMSVYILSQEIRCTITEYAPTWDAMEKEIKEFYYSLLDAIITEIIKTSLKKIEVYKSYEEMFKDDDYRHGKIVAVIAEENQVISLLDRHGKR
jgi:hypothetical protein